MTRIGSLCSGYEGLGAAVSAIIGGELAFVADIDPGASALLAHRFPGVPNIGDIKAVDWASLGAVDILCGGYPCQPFSAAGRRLGTGDERHLWPYIAKGIGVLRPPLVVLENVQGHLTLGFDAVLADLAGLGYDAEWVIVTASAAGACHRRARLFILAFPARPRVVAGVPVAVIEDGAWLEPRESLFGVLPYAGRVPASGSMAGGVVRAVDDGPAVMTAGLLKTPTAQLAVNGGSQHPDKRRAGGHGPTLADQVEHELLPTPTAREKGGRNARHGDTSHGDDLPEAIRYLPTPNATDGKGSGGAAGRMRDGRPRASGDADLSEAVALLPTPAARDGKGRDMPGRRGGKSLPETLLPTPTAADGDRASATYPRGNATLIGALLPTPRATDGEKGGPNQRGSSGDLMLPSAVMQLLPTPSVADGTGGHKTRSGDRKGEPLLGGIGMLLPTPVVTNRAGMDPSPATVRGTRGADLGPAVGGVLRGSAPGVVDWGPYEAAIRRWEAVTGRPAPEPTVPGKTGRRLNPALPEWMMGLPAGWITEVPGLSRNAMLKAAGNGVVPQQAELALRLLLDRAGLAGQERAA